MGITNYETTFFTPLSNYEATNWKKRGIYLFDPLKKDLDKLNTNEIPVEITINNDLLGFAPSFIDLEGNIYFNFGSTIRISPNNKVDILRDGLPETTKLNNYNYYELPSIDSVGVALLESDKIYKISPSFQAELMSVCYFQLTFGDANPCEGYRLVLRTNSKQIVLPNFDENEEASKYDSSFIYIPFDKNFFMSDRSFIFLSQTNQLFRFK